MSSDSDSDICDLTSNVSKHFSKSKSFNQFWARSKEKKVSEVEPNDHPNNVNNGDTKLVLITNQTLGNSSKQDDTEIVCNPDKSENIHNRIINKLDQLSEEVEMILQTKGKRKKRKGKRIWVQKNKRNTRSNQQAPIEITLSSDDEAQSLKPQTNIHPVEADEEVNPIVTINVLWKSMEKNSFKLHKYHSLKCILTYYSEKCNVNPKLLFFTLEDKLVNLKENSFVSLRLDERKVIEGGILPESYLEDLEKNLGCTNTAVNDLNFKVQWDDRKNKEINVTCNRNDKMEIIFSQIVNITKHPIENIKLSFDGQVLHPNSKLVNLDLEEGDCFDMSITK